MSAYNTFDNTKVLGEFRNQDDTTVTPNVNASATFDRNVTVSGTCNVTNLSVTGTMGVPFKIYSLSTSNDALNILDTSYNGCYVDVVADTAAIYVSSYGTLTHYKLKLFNTYTTNGYTNPSNYITIYNNTTNRLKIYTDSLPNYNTFGSTASNEVIISNGELITFRSDGFNWQTASYVPLPLHILSSSSDIYITYPGIYMTINGVTNSNLGAPNGIGFTRAIVPRVVKVFAQGSSLRLVVYSNDSSRVVNIPNFACYSFITNGSYWFVDSICTSTN